MNSNQMLPTFNYGENDRRVSRNIATQGYPELRNGGNE